MTVTFFDGVQAYAHVTVSKTTSNETTNFFMEYHLFINYTMSFRRSYETFREAEADRITKALTNLRVKSTQVALAFDKALEKV